MTSDPHLARERRRHTRWPLKLPVRVQGRDTDGSILEEMTTCEDASSGGASLLLRHSVRQGQVLHLSLPLPSRFRQYDVTSQSYRVYALVRAVASGSGGTDRVGVLFYGRNPPQGADSLPGGLFLVEGDPRPGPAGGGFPVRLRLAAAEAPGGLEHEEQAVVEHFSAGGARVRVTRLPAMKGMILRVEQVGGHLGVGAEVSQILIGADGHPRVDLVFLNGVAPQSWGSASRSSDA